MNSAMPALYFSLSIVILNVPFLTSILMKHRIGLLSHQNTITAHSSSFLCTVMSRRADRLCLMTTRTPKIELQTISDGTVKLYGCSAQMLHWVDQRSVTCCSVGCSPMVRFDLARRRCTV